MLLDGSSSSLARAILREENRISNLSGRASRVPGVPRNRVTGIRNIKLFAVRSRGRELVGSRYRHLKSRLKNVISVANLLPAVDAREVRIIYL